MLAFFGILSLLPAQHAVDLKVSVHPVTVTVGDEISFRVEVRCPAGTSVTPPDTGDELGAFTVKSVRSTNLAGGRSWTFVLSRFDTGRTNIPALGFVYEGPSGAGTVSTREVGITVESILKKYLTRSTNVELRDIKPQLSMKDRSLPVKLLILFGVLAGGILVFLLRRRGLRETPDLLAPSVPGLPPDQAALEALDRIVSSGILEKEGVKQFCSLINEVIRTYLARRYGVMTLERTSDEILAELSALYIERVVLEGIGLFFEVSDLVKFARLSPDANALRAFTERAYLIVRVTRASAPAAAAGPAPSGPDGGPA